MRSHEQIIGECEAAYDRLKSDLERRDEAAKKEYERPFNRLPCRKCAHAEIAHYIKCAHPLVKGIHRNAGFVDTLAEIQRNAPLCGEEKALWEKRRAWPVRVWLRFWAWFLMPFSPPQTRMPEKEL